MEDVGDRDVPFQFAPDPADQLDRLEALAALLEEIGVDAVRPAAEHLGEEAQQSRFDRRARFGRHAVGHRAASGSGSAARLTLPFGMTGSAGGSITVSGTICAGSVSRSASRTRGGVQPVPDA